PGPAPIDHHEHDIPVLLVSDPGSWIAVAEIGAAVGWRHVPRLAKDDGVAADLVDGVGPAESPLDRDLRAHRKPSQDARLGPSRVGVEHDVPRSRTARAAAVLAHRVWADGLPVLAPAQPPRPCEAD